MHRSTRLSASLLLLLGAFFCVTTLASADDTATLSIQAGETLEIGVETASSQTEFSWILTKDRTFIGAQRNRYFQTRIAQPGSYVLDVNIQNARLGSSDYRALTVNVGETPAITKERNRQGPTKAVANVTPIWPTDAKVLLQKGGIVAIDPQESTGPIDAYFLDLNAAIDSDGDGNPANDNDVAGTLFERTGTRLYVWLQPSDSNRTVSLAVRSTDGSQSSSVVKIADGSGVAMPRVVTPAAIPSTERIGENIIAKKKGQVVELSLERDFAGVQTLETWDFGDGKRSLLGAPVHTYDAPGTYTIRVSITDIARAQVIAEYQGTVTIEAAVPEEPTSAASSSVASSQGVATNPTQENPQKEGRFTSIIARGKSLIVVGGILFLLLAIAMALYALFLWIKKITAGRLQHAIEKMEGTLVGKQQTTATVQEALPLQLKTPVKPAEKTEIIAERELGKKEFIKNKDNAPTAAVSTGPVPPWLASAPKAPPSTPPSQTTVAPPKPPPPPSPSPSPVSSTPPWLQQKTPPPAPPSTPLAATSAVSTNLRDSTSAPAVTPPKPAIAKTLEPTKNPAGNGPVPPWLAATNAPAPMSPSRDMTQGKSAPVSPEAPGGTPTNSSTSIPPTRQESSMPSEERVKPTVAAQPQSPADKAPQSSPENVPPARSEKNIAPEPAERMSSVQPPPAQPTVQPAETPVPPSANKENTRTIAPIKSAKVAGEKEEKRQSGKQETDAATKENPVRTDSTLTSDQPKTPAIEKKEAPTMDDSNAENAKSDEDTILTVEEDIPTVIDEQVQAPGPLAPLTPAEPNGTATTAEDDAPIAFIRAESLQSTPGTQSAA